MKILLCSVPYRPSIGGIESVSAMLAHRWQALGHEVVLVTRTRDDAAPVEPFRVVRAPGAVALLHWTRWSDVVIHNNISLRWAWPMLVVHRPWVIAHHTWLPFRGPGSTVAAVKRSATRLARNIAVSESLAAALACPCTVIGNPFDDQVFRRHRSVERDLDLVFVGRLVAEKGLDVVLRALSLLARVGQRPTLTVIGAGPAEADLRRLATSHALDRQVRFAGALAPADVARELNRHRALVMPSLCEGETFGIAALEALACGCLPIVSRRGGLPEAVGAHGLTVDAGDAAAWATALIEGLRGDTRERLLCSSEGHLWCRTPDRVAKDYLEVLTQAIAAGHGHVARA